MAKITTAMKRTASHHSSWITTIPSGLRFLRSPQDRLKPAEGKPRPGPGARIGGLTLAAAPQAPGRGRVGRPGNEHERRPLMSRRPESTARRYGKVFDE